MRARTGSAQHSGLANLSCCSVAYIIFSLRDGVSPIMRPPHDPSVRQTREDGPKLLKRAFRSCHHISDFLVLGMVGCLARGRRFSLSGAKFVPKSASLHTHIASCAAITVAVAPLVCWIELRSVVLLMASVTSAIRSMNFSSSLSRLVLCVAGDMVYSFKPAISVAQHGSGRTDTLPFN